MRKSYLIVFLIFFYSINISGQNQIKKSVLGNGYSNSSNTSYKIQGTVGQSIIGKTNNTSNYINQGFWYTQQISGGLPVVGISEETSSDSVSATYIGKIFSNGGNAISEKGILLSTSPNPTLGDYLYKLISNEDTDSYKLKFTGLENSTTYYARAYATNIIGTSYSPAQYALLHDIDGISFDIEKGVNRQDGNGDGIPDWAQNNVVSFTSIYPQHGYITIAVGTGINLINVRNLPQEESINSYYYPYGITSFSIAASHVDVEIYFHAVNTLENFKYRKINLLNQYEDFQNARFETVEINGNKVAKITLNLEDGGSGDSDGIVNGIITDPGGPAIAMNNLNNLQTLFLNTLTNNIVNIPTFSEYIRIVAIITILLFISYFYFKS